VSWPLVKLGTIGEFKAGYGFPHKYQGETSGDMPFAKVGDISAVARRGDKYIFEARNFINKDELKQIKAKSVPVNTIVFAKIGEAIRQNFRAVTSVETVIDNNSMGLVPNVNLIDVDYLYHFMCKLDLYRYTGATTVPAIRKSTLEEIEIPLPPLAEQKRIAAILDKADAIRRKRQQAIKLADDFLRSIFIEMFGDPITNPKGWEIKSLSTLCNKITDGTHHSPPIVEKGVPYITAKHLKKTGLEFFAKPWYISEESHQNIYSRCNPEINDVLYIKDGATTGLAAINEYDFEFSMLSSLALLKPDYEKITSEFLCVFLNHPRIKLVLTANMAGAAITRLTLSKIKVVKVPLPDLDSQKKFTQVYTNVKALVTKVKISSEQASENFNSLSQKAFAGAL
jgi:type I restriction enzyme S subunit